MVSEEEIKNIVIEGYRNILKRDPDFSGLENYTNEIKRGLTVEEFHHILRTSDEYIKKFEIGSIVTEMMTKVLKIQK